MIEHQRAKLDSESVLLFDVYVMSMHRSRKCAQAQFTHTVVGRIQRCIVLNDSAQ
jgi:hypothetical protein